MRSEYRISINLELSSKCNARCAMCPRDLIPKPTNMNAEIFNRVLERVRAREVHRVVVAGYGEPTAHPKFDEFTAAIREHPASFDLVTNGSLLTEERLRSIDGAIRTMIVSFSSVDPSVYEGVHVGLRQSEVMENLERANHQLKSTKLAISLTPLRPCLETLPETIQWLKSNGIEALTMSPTVYDRATGGPIGGAEAPTTEELRAVIRRYGLISQEFDFVPSVRDIWRQWRSNQFKCVARNTDILVSADGLYMYCFNDIRHSHSLGHVDDLSVGEALRLREQTGPESSICDRCNMRRRYGSGEASRTFYRWLAA